MHIETITLEALADLLEDAEILRREDAGPALRLDILHPGLGAVTTIQAGETVFVIQPAPAA